MKKTIAIIILTLFYFSIPIALISAFLLAGYLIIGVAAFLFSDPLDIIHLN
jgi:hypothetical protein